ncbi:ubiA prenyltransferase domain-containing protein 1 homolog [Agrilus planipennis]|uniref:UbiA prenyltransferase domain-containing protein 1 homolog n=1 Tax=Agrilus planipennis TaxID=224129 RepID=A0A1W4WQU9_AGRPL|nr:ubiA prenyltransferase domain-containing protein 1 homolog [Agrilus planipennis]
MAKRNFLKFEQEENVDETLVNGKTKPPIKQQKSGLMKFSNYFIALRPWSLSGSLMPTLLGCTIAQKYPGDVPFSYLNLIFTVLTVVSVHGAGNLVNTYFDYIKGIDNRKADDRTLVDHILTEEEVVTLGALLYLIGCVGFVMLTTLSPAKMEHLALVYFGGISSSFLYTGGIGFKYIALAQTGRIEWACIYYAIPLALNTEAILHSNNTRDMELDRKNGIVTLAILIGHTASYILYAFLLFIPYIMLMVMSFKYSKWFMLPLITLPRAFEIEKQFRSGNIQNIPRKTAKLNLILGILYILSCSFIPSLPFISK